MKQIESNRKSQTGKGKKDREILRRLLKAFLPYKWRFLLIAVAILMIAGLNFLSPLAVRSIFDDAIPQHHLDLLWRDVLILVGIPVLSGGITIAQTYISSRVGQNIIRDFRNQLYVHLQRISFQFFTSTHIGETQSRLSNDVSGIQLIVTNTVNTIFLNISVLLSIIVAMLYLSPLLTFITFAVLPLFLWITAKVGSTSRRTQRKTQEGLAALTALVQETLSVSGILLIKTFGRQHMMQERFAQKNQQLADMGVHLQMVSNWFNALVNLIFAFTPAVVYLIAGGQIIERSNLAGITLGGMIAFTYLQAKLLPAIGQLLSVQVQIHTSLALFERIFDYLDLPVEITDAPQAVSLHHAALAGKVTFEDVTFTYKRDEVGTSTGTAKENGSWRQLPSFALNGKGIYPTLNHISFDIEPGQLVALVGPSGAGKTTISYLLPRLYEVDSGAVKIDGLNVKNIRLQSLSDAIGMVTQETYLLHATVRENLLFAHPGAGDEELFAACRAAAIHNRIVELDHGYDTIVGERGYKLSGGEKQRIAIARAILKNPPILILDEATSSLDTASEQFIQLALESLMKSRTTIAIAHRLSTIRTADLILVLDNGRIVERGTHQELLQRQGTYAQLYNRQFHANVADTSLL